MTFSPEQLKTIEVNTNDPQKAAICREFAELLEAVAEWLPERREKAD